MYLDIFLMGFIFIMIHLFANQFIPADQVKQSKWLSFSGGLAVAYVFVYILPFMHGEQRSLQDYIATENRLPMESELYFIALLGLLLYYGIQKIIYNSDEISEESAYSNFWMQIGFFTVYNSLVAYTAVTSAVTGIQAFFYTTAIGLHFIAVAHDLWHGSPERYNRYGRFVVASGILVGWGVGFMFSFPSVVQSSIFAFISGAMILNVLKNELPHEKHAHFPSFFLGVMSYSIITMGIKYFFEW